MTQRFTVHGTWTIEVLDELSALEGGFQARRRDPLTELMPDTEAALPTAIAALFTTGKDQLPGVRIVAGEVVVDAAAEPFVSSGE